MSKFYMWINETTEMVYTNFQALEKIKKIILEVTGLSFEQYNSTTRKREIVYARQLFMFMAKKHTTLSLKSIGELFKKNYENSYYYKKDYKGFDHSTVIHAIETITNILTSFAKTREQKVIKNAIELWK